MFTYRKFAHEGNVGVEYAKFFSFDAEFRIRTFGGKVVGEPMISFSLVDDGLLEAVDFDKSELVRHPSDSVSPFKIDEELCARFWMSSFSAEGKSFACASEFLKHRLIGDPRLLRVTVAKHVNWNSEYCFHDCVRCVVLCSLVLTASFKTLE